MKLFAIDTTTKFFCLGAYDGKSAYEYNIEAGTRLSSLIAETIKRVLDGLGWRPEEIDYFACGLGPGSFTGTRIGVATIKGMSWALKKPVVGISTLDILAANVWDGGLIVPAIDAKRNLIYCSAYKNNRAGLRRVSPYMLLGRDEFMRNTGANSVIFGDAVGLYREEIHRNIPGVKTLDKDYWYPKAHNIITLALERIKNNKIDDAFKIKPIYLYPKECQIKNSK